MFSLIGICSVPQGSCNAMVCTQLPGPFQPLLLPADEVGSEMTTKIGACCQSLVPGAALWLVIEVCRKLCSAAVEGLEATVVESFQDRPKRAMPSLPYWVRPLR